MEAGGVAGTELRRRILKADPDNDADDDMGELSVERIFEGKPVPSWGEQLTFRAIVVSTVLGFFLSFIVMKLMLTTGIVPSLNVSAGLLGFFFVKAWTKGLESLGLLKQPFTRQENTVIQTCCVACSGIAFSGGYGSYLLGMSPTVAKQQTENKYMGVNTKELSLGWIIAFLFLVSFVGIFSVMPLRKIMIVGYKLSYPSGTATAHLINSFHTPQGAKIAKKQVSLLFKSFGGSFLWAFFQWFYTAGDDCGFVNFPSFGLLAFKNKLFFDFSLTYIGVGMICPYIINISLLVGSIISWGILWPYIKTKKGDWYSESLPEKNMQGLRGYQVFIPIAIFLGDGLYHFLEVIIKSSYDIYNKNKKDQNMPVIGEAEAISFDEERRNQLFLKDQIPTWVAVVSYIGLATISIIAVPLIFHQLKFYHIILIYLIAPPLAFCNAYGCGLTDWSLASSYGKLAIFIIGAWVGVENGGILAGLAACGVMMSIVSTASDLIQDFKTGYLTLASPKSMFVSQLIGTAMGCVISPSVFWIFYKSFPVGVDGTEYPAPYAGIYRGIAIIGTQGSSALPRHCLQFCFVAFAAAIAINGFKEFLRYRNCPLYKWVPSAMGMAIPFYQGGFFAIDMCLGSLILFIWEKSNLRHSEAFAPALASGLICGDGIWSLPSSLLALAKVKPPMCLLVFAGKNYDKVSALLDG